MAFAGLPKELVHRRRCPLRSWQQSNRGFSIRRSNEAVRQEVATLKNPDELRRENEVLRDRLSRLSAVVLQREPRPEHRPAGGRRERPRADRRPLRRDHDHRRPRTGLRVRSSGLTSEEHRQLAEWPDRPRLFEHLRELPGPLRLRDARAFQSVVEVDQFYGIEIPECPGRIAATALWMDGPHHE